MKREGRQHGVVKTGSIDGWYPVNYYPRPAGPLVNRFDFTPAFGVFAKVSSKPTNHSKFTGKCEWSRYSTKSVGKSKGCRKQYSSDLWAGQDKLDRLFGSDSSSASDILDTLLYGEDYYDVHDDDF